MGNPEFRVPPSRQESTIALQFSQAPVAPREILRAALGAGLGIVLTAVLSTVGLGGSLAAPSLIAPMGASAALMFAIPASPLAQPYAVIAGHLLAAVIGVTCAKLVPIPILAAGLAVAGAIAAMAACRCIHPPSGAVALVAVLGGPHVTEAGYGFVVAPLLLNTVLLLAAAVLYNRATGRTYPHRAHAPAQTQPAQTPGRLVRADFEAAIADYGEPLAIDAADLETLFRDLQRRAARSGPIAR